MSTMHLPTQLLLLAAGCSLASTATAHELRTEPSIAPSVTDWATIESAHDMPVPHPGGGHDDVYDPIDRDNDGIADRIDNCTRTSNASQYDSNGDGFGNACDQDLNSDCYVDFSDFTLFRERIFTDDPDADFNGNGTVDFEDFLLLREAMFGSAGPTALPYFCQVHPDQAP